MIKALQIIEKYWLLLSICILLVITTLSLWPLNNLPSVPGTDKTHHLIAYAVLVFPTALRKPNRWILLVAFFIFYGGLIELVQPYVNRYGEWLDMLANTIGVICGILLASVMKTFNKRKIEE
jgi:VanZ family protein